MLVFLSVELLAHHYGVSEGTIRRWASEDRWTPCGTRRHRLWSLNEADASYHRRHGKEDPDGDQRGMISAVSNERTP